MADGVRHALLWLVEMWILLLCDLSICSDGVLLVRVFLWRAKRTFRRSWVNSSFYVSSSLPCLSSDQVLCVFLFEWIKIKWQWRVYTLLDYFADFYCSTFRNNWYKEYLNISVFHGPPFLGLFVCDLALFLLEDELSFWLNHSKYLFSSRRSIFFFLFMSFHSLDVEEVSLKLDHALL